MREDTGVSSRGGPFFGRRIPRRRTIAIAIVSVLLLAALVTSLVDATREPDAEDTPLGPGESVRMLLIDSDGQPTVLHSTYWDDTAHIRVHREADGSGQTESFVLSSNKEVSTTEVSEATFAIVSASDASSEVSQSILIPVPGYMTVTESHVSGRIAEVAGPNRETGRAIRAWDEAIRGQASTAFRAPEIQLITMIFFYHRDDRGFIQHQHHIVGAHSELIRLPCFRIAAIEEYLVRTQALGINLERTQPSPDFAAMWARGIAQAKDASATIQSNLYGDANSGWIPAPVRRGPAPSGAGITNKELRTAPIP